MGRAGEQASRPLSIAECPICSRLGDAERSYARRGSEELTILLPDAARHLVGLEGQPASSTMDAPSGQCVLSCPVCGTCYRYTWDSDDLASGSEERSELRRLAPAQARPLLDEAAYALLMSWTGLWLSDEDAAVRRQAARSLAAHHAAAGALEPVVFLLKSADVDVVRGTLFLLRDVQREGEWPLALAPLREVLVALRASKDEELAAVATFLLGHLEQASSEGA